jgi:hypothetical protein
MLGTASEMNEANLSLSPLQVDSCASEKASIVKKIIGKWTSRKWMPHRNKNIGKFVSTMFQWYGELYPEYRKY